MDEFPQRLLEHIQGLGAARFGGSGFSKDYACYSFAMAPGLRGSAAVERERGGKILLPPSALEVLSRLLIQFPMLFRVVNRNGGGDRAVAMDTSTTLGETPSLSSYDALVDPAPHRTTHCGVLEFIAEEGRVYMPFWMMTNLGLKEADTVHIENVPLPTCTFAKFQPQSTDFLNISNPKAVLEKGLRSFACLTLGDVIAIAYNDRIYHLEVKELKPQNAVTIIECDMEVDFEAPIGYEEPKPVAVPKAPKVLKVEKLNDSDVSDSDDSDDDSAKAKSSRSALTPFGGSGQRIDGKPLKGRPTSSTAPAPIAATAAVVPPTTTTATTTPAHAPNRLTFLAAAERRARQQQQQQQQQQPQGHQQEAAEAAHAQAQEEPSSQEEQTPSFQPFTGVGHKLR